MKYTIEISTAESRMLNKEFYRDYDNFDTAIRLYRLLVDDIKATDGYYGTEITLMAEDGRCIDSFRKEEDNHEEQI